MKHLPSALLSLAALAAPSFAQNPLADVPSGIAGGTATIRVQGEPNAPYFLWWSSEEALTQVGDLLLFVDPFRSIENSLFLGGVLDPSGLATYSFPTTPEWHGDQISWQVVVAGGSVGISNLARATFQESNTFREAVGVPASFSILGDLFPLADGRVLAIGGAGPLVEAYEPWDQQTLPAGIAQPNYPFSARAPLADGKILVCGGITAGLTNGSLAIQTTSEAYLFNPLTGDFIATNGPMGTARAAHTATRLPSGKVLVFGGIGTIDLANPVTLLTGILGSSEIYDPATGLFTAGATLLEGKAFHTATLLDNGQVLVAGGLGVAFSIPFVSNTGYTYNPSNNSFSLLPKTFTGGRLLHTATKLADGKVLLAGGFTADLSGLIETGDLSQITLGTVATTTVFNPAGFLGGSFGNGPTMAESRALHTATLLPGNRALVAGGLSGEIDLGGLLTGDLGSLVLPTVIGTSELLGFNPNAAVAGPSLVAPRAGASAIVSPMDGRVIVFGGGPLQVELYQP